MILGMTPPKRVPLTRTSVFLSTAQHRRLTEIQQATGIPAAHLIRQGVDLILKKYARVSRRRGSR